MENKETHLTTAPELYNQATKTLIVQLSLGKAELSDIAAFLDQFVLDAKLKANIKVGMLHFEAALNTVNKEIARLKAAEITNKAVLRRYAKERRVLMIQAYESLTNAYVASFVALRTVAQQNNDLVFQSTEQEDVLRALSCQIKSVSAPSVEERQVLNLLARALLSKTDPTVEQAEQVIRAAMQVVTYGNITEMVLFTLEELANFRVAVINYTASLDTLLSRK